MRQTNLLKPTNASSNPKKTAFDDREVARNKLGKSLLFVKRFRGLMAPTHGTSAADAARARVFADRVAQRTVNETSNSNAEFPLLTALYAWLAISGRLLIMGHTQLRLSGIYRPIRPGLPKISAKTALALVLVWSSDCSAQSTCNLSILQECQTQTLLCLNQSCGTTLSQSFAAEKQALDNRRFRTLQAALLARVTLQNSMANDVEVCRATCYSTLGRCRIDAGCAP